MAALQAQLQLRKSVLVVGKHAVCEWMAEVPPISKACRVRARPEFALCDCHSTAECLHDTDGG